MDSRRKWNKEEYDEEIDLIPILKRLWHCARLVAFAALASGLLVLFVTLIFKRPVYTSSFVVYANSQADTYAEIITSDGVLTEAGGAAGLTYSLRELKSLVSTDVNSTKKTITVSVNGANPENALKLAQSVEATAAAHVPTVIDGAVMKIVNEPQLQDGMSSPNYKKNTLIAAFLGAFCAAGVIVLLEILVGKVHCGAQLVESFGLAVLGIIPAEEVKKQSKLCAILHRINSPWFRKVKEPSPVVLSSAEAYNVLGANLAMMLPGAEAKVIALTDADEGVKKGEVAMRLGSSLSLDKKKVIVIDCDMSAPSITQTAELDKQPGLSDYLTGIGSQEDYIKSVPGSEMYVLSAGSLTPDPSWLLTSDCMSQLVDTLRGEYDYVLLALPPITAISDVAPIAKFTDGFLTVVSHEHTRMRKISDALRALDNAHSVVLGFVYAL